MEKARRENLFRAFASAGLTVHRPRAPALGIYKFNLVARRRAIEHLKKNDMGRDFSAHPLGTIVLILIGVGAGILAGFAAAVLFDIQRGEAFVVTFALAAAALGYWQWRSGRHEASLDHFYERMSLSNELRLEAHRAALQHSTLDSSGEDPTDRRGQGTVSGEIAEQIYEFFVLTELDNLEYAVEKFRLGYMRAELADRALRTFEQRCKSAHLPVMRALEPIDFIELVQRFVLGPSPAATYNAHTRTVVQSVVSRLADGEVDG